jgi:hypothetical protein
VGPGLAQHRLADVRVEIGQRALCVCVCVCGTTRNTHER